MTITHKHCPECERTLPLAEFHRDLTRKGGYCRLCKDCRARAKSRAYLIESHRDKALHYRDQYRAWKQRARDAEALVAAIGLKKREVKALARGLADALEEGTKVFPEVPGGAVSAAYLRNVLRDAAGGSLRVA